MWSRLSATSGWPNNKINASWSFSRDNAGLGALILDDLEQSVIVAALAKSWHGGSGCGRYGPWAVPLGSLRELELGRLPDPRIPAHLIGHMSDLSSHAPAPAGRGRGPEIASREGPQASSQGPTRTSQGPPQPEP